MDEIYIVTWIDDSMAATVFTAQELADWATQCDFGNVNYIMKWHRLNDGAWEAE